MKRHVRFALGLFFLAFCLVVAPIQASNYTGGGADPNDWFDADNWGPSAAFGGNGDVPMLFLDGGLHDPMPAFGATFGNNSFTFNQVGASSDFLVIGSTGGQFPFNIEGGDLTFGGDGLIGVGGFDGVAAGPATINQTGGVLTQVGGGAGFLIGHSEAATYNISGGMVVVDIPSTGRQLGIDTPDFGGSGNQSLLNISGTGIVDVKDGVNIRIGPAGVIDILDDGQLIWRNRTLTDVAALGGTIRATAEQVGPDVVFTTDRSPDVLLVANIDRDTGAIEVTNSTGGPVDIASYSVVSQAGTLNSSNWVSIAATGDSNSGGSIDPDDVWNEFSAAGSAGDLSEGTVGMATIPDGGSLNLDDGANGAWSPYFQEASDISFQYLTGAGEVLQGLVRFAGNDGNPYAFGDLNFDSQPLNAADWDTFVANYGADLTGLSAAQRYRLSDLTGDGVHDVDDFNQFKSIFDAANGAGAFAAMIARVPEPTSLLTATLAIVCGVSLSRATMRRRSFQGLLLVLAVATIAAVTPTVQASTWTNADADGDFFNGNNWDGLGDFTGGPGEVPNQANSIGLSVGAVPIELNQAGMTALYMIAGNDVSITGGDFTYTGDGLWGSEIGGAIGGIGEQCLGGGDCPIFTQTAGTVTQTGGGAGFIVGHTLPGSYSISGGTVVVQNTSPALIVDAGGLFTGGNPSTLSISGNGTVDVDADRIRFGAEATLNVTGNGRLIWRNKTVADVFSTLSGGVFEDAKVIADSAVINAEPIQVGNDVHFVEGVTEVVPLKLTVNPGSGELTLSGATIADNINFYEITSENGLLNPTGWTSGNLDAQNIDSLGAGSNESWSTLKGTTGNLTEAFLSGSSIFDSSRSESLGIGYNASLDDPENRDLVMVVGTTNGSSRTIPIVYIDGESFDGDDDWDGRDLLFWQRGQSPNPFSAEDLAEWGDKYGTGVGVAAAAAAVPEPASWASLLLGLVIVGLTVSLRTARHARAPLTLAAGVGLLLVAVSPQAAQAGTVERDYQLGDDALENASVGAVLGTGAGNPSPGNTLDSFGPLPGTFIDIAVQGNPTYANVSDRPGAGAGDLGGSFDGANDSLRTAISMNSPSGMVTNQEFFPTGYLRDYTGIFSHGMQLWAKPTPGGLILQRQDLIIDTPQHGIVIAPNTITENEVERDINAWALQFAGQLIVSETEVDTASDNGWTHVMQLAGFGDVTNGKSTTGGALLINGVAVAASSASYGEDGTALSIASNQDNTGNFYNGLLDNVQLFFWGDNSGGGPLTADWGPLDLSVDNEWIAARFAEKAAAAGVGAIPAGDVNFDGQVSGDGTGAAASDDVRAFIDNWFSRNLVSGVQVGDWNSRQGADLNFDGVVDLFDWQILRGAHPAGSSLNLGALLADTVPEPFSLALAAPCLIMLGLNRRIRPCQH